MRFLLGAVILYFAVRESGPQELLEATSSLAKITGFLPSTPTRNFINLFLVCVILRYLHVTAFLPLFSENCRMPLGMASGEIKNEQITAPSAYNNDFSTFGAHRARLNLSSWPPGYRADPNQGSGWIKVELGKKMVITAIATQGYGDPLSPEWIEQYMVMYSNGGDYLYFQNLEGDLEVSVTRIANRV